MRKLLPFLLLTMGPASAVAAPAALARDFPRLDLGKSLINPDELASGGVPRDGIPALVAPEFRPVPAIRGLGEREPMLVLTGACGTFAFPYRVLIWHEVVNHDQCGAPVVVTFCPLCNASMVFRRQIGGAVLSFGTSGLLRNSDLVMYDHQSETLWQQFTGEAIVGHHVGATLTVLPARIMAWRELRREFPAAQVLVPPRGSHAAYGDNPYVGYDSAPRPFLYRGHLPADVNPLERVVRVGDRAWSLAYVQRHTPVQAADGLRIDWHQGLNSVTDEPMIADGRDVGVVSVTRGGTDVAFSVDFAFAYRAFFPHGELTTR